MGLILNVLFSIVVAALAFWHLQPSPSGHALPRWTFGPSPTLPSPSPGGLGSTAMKFAKRDVDLKWMPTVPAGFRVSLFYRNDLDHPRWLRELSNGDILVAESKTEISWWRSLEDFVAWYFLGLGGHVGRSRNRISLIRNGVRHTLVENLKQPLGMVVKDGFLYVGNTDSIVRFPFKVGDLKISAPAEKLIDLPAGGYNNHWTRNFEDAGPDKLLVSIGSAGNIGERGYAEDKDRALVAELSISSRKLRTVSAGLRNPVGLARHPDSGEVWTVVNERDLLGDDLVPDYMTRVKEGLHYGWPYEYFGITDTRVGSDWPPLTVKTTKPDFALGAHTASLGIDFSPFHSDPIFGNGAFIGQHGSWNRQQFSGYQVLFVPFDNSTRLPSTLRDPIPFLTGFIRNEKDSTVYGRPVGVLAIKNALLVADDSGDAIWKVEKQ